MIHNNKSDVDLALKNLALDHPYALQQYSHIQAPPRVKVPNEAIGKDEKFKIFMWWMWICGNHTNRCKETPAC